jgi:hypothetical protein
VCVVTSVENVVTSVENVVMRVENVVMRVASVIRSVSRQRRRFVLSCEVGLGPLRTCTTAQGVWR